MIEDSKSTLVDANILTSAVVPLSFQLRRIGSGAAIRIQHQDQKQMWSVEIDAA
jgi:hypothetical protein